MCACVCSVCACAFVCLVVCVCCVSTCVSVGGCVCILGEDLCVCAFEYTDTQGGGES